MKISLDQLNAAGREELALAILLWKDFKCQGKLDVVITEQAIQFVQMLGVEDEFYKLLPILPPLEIKPRA